MTDNLQYNIQGWGTVSQTVKGSETLYSQKLSYYDAEKGSGLYNGNISEWRMQQGTNAASTYRYGYDGLGRLTTSSRYAESGTSATNSWCERGIDYDLNGNIVTLQRFGSSASTAEDNLFYDYSGNGYPQLATNLYKYNGKEVQTIGNLGFTDYGARMYDDFTGRWFVPDPLAEKYASMSPYMYCGGNPILMVDVDGQEVKPKGAKELEMIQNTIPAELRSFVRVNDHGNIDKSLINSYNGNINSGNYNNLKQMVNSNLIVEVELNNEFTYMMRDGNLGVANMSYNKFDPIYDLESDKDKEGNTMSNLSTGESGFLGKTLFPDREGIQNSPNKHIMVIVNKNLSKQGAAEIYSHEAYGHALLYILNGSNHEGASHQPINGSLVEGNLRLKQMITNSKKETIKT